MKTLDAVIASSNQPDQKLLSWMLLVQRLCFIITGIIATVILCGWLIPAFGAILPTGWALMKANTALAMLLSTASLALIQQEQSDRRTLISRICAALVVLLAGAALFGHITGRSVALNTLLAADSSADMPGRMSIQTAAFLMLLGLALVFEGKWQKRHSHVVDLLTIILGVITLVIIAGYCFGAAQLFGQSPSTRTSLQTLVCMATLGFAIVVRRTQAGFFSVFIGMGIGSHIARIALPFALLLPFLVVGSGAYLMLAGSLSAPYAAALTASITALLLCIIVVLMARRVNDLEQHLREISLTDELTKIYNRRGFYLLGEPILSEGRRLLMPLTILYFDLDGLKEVNDTLGHDTGSQLVLDFANLLRTTFRSSDVVARVGGDEFAVVARSRQADIMIALKRLDAAIEAANSTGEKPYQISYSVGEAASEPTADESFAELVARADAVMYERKRLKKAARASTAETDPGSRQPLPAATVQEPR